MERNPQDNVEGRVKAGIERDSARLRGEIAALEQQLTSARDRYDDAIAREHKHWPAYEATGTSRGWHEAMIDAEQAQSETFRLRREIDQRRRKLAALDTPREFRDRVEVTERLDELHERQRRRQEAVA